MAWCQGMPLRGVVVSQGEQRKEEEGSQKLEGRLGGRKEKRKAEKEKRRKKRNGRCWAGTGSFRPKPHFRSFLSFAFSFLLKSGLISLI